MVAADEPHAQLVATEHLVAVEADVQDARRGIAGNEHCAREVGASIQRVVGRDRQAGQVGVGARPDDFLDGRILDNLGRNRMRLLLGIVLHHVPYVGTQRQCQAIVGGGEVHDGRHFGVADGLEVQSRELALLLEFRRDRGHAEPRIDFLANDFDLVRPLFRDLGNERPQVFRHG